MANSSKYTERQPALATVCLSSQLVSPAKGGQARARTIRLLSTFDKLNFAGLWVRIGTTNYAPGSRDGPPFSRPAPARSPRPAPGRKSGYNGRRRKSDKPFT